MPLLSPPQKNPVRNQNLVVLLSPFMGVQCSIWKLTWKVLPHQAPSPQKISWEIKVARMLFCGTYSFHGTFCNKAYLGIFHFSSGCWYVQLSGCNASGESFEKLDRQICNVFRRNLYRYPVLQRSSSGSSSKSSNSNSIKRSIKSNSNSSSRTGFCFCTTATA